MKSTVPQPPQLQMAVNASFFPHTEVVFLGTWITGMKENYRETKNTPGRALAFGCLTKFLILILRMCKVYILTISLEMLVPSGCFVRIGEFKF